MSSELQSLITVTIDGFGPVGVWDDRSGGLPKSNPPLHREGGSSIETSYAALKSYDPVTVSRVLDNEKRQDSALFKQLLPFAGQATMTVIEQPLDTNLNAFGPPTVYSGRFSGMDQGKSDSNSENPRMWSLDMTCTNVT